MVNINQIKKQFQLMQRKLHDMQEQMSTAEFTGTSGGGMVTAVVTGKGEVRSIKIDPSLLKAEEREILEDLLVAAINDAKKKADSDSENNMSDMMGGLGLPPGFKLPF